MWKTAKAPGVTHFDDDALGFGILVTNKGDTEKRNAASTQRLYRQEAVINRSERRPGTEHHWFAPLCNDIDINDIACQRHQHPAGPLHDQRPVRIRQNERLRIDGNAINLGSKMWRSRRLQPIGLRQHALFRQTGKPQDRLPVRLLQETGLDRFPIDCSKSTGERSSKNSLANAGIGTSYNDARGHAAFRMSSASASNKPATIASSTFAVSAMRTRALPSATVGGRIARISKPRRCKEAASATAA